MATFSLFASGAVYYQARYEDNGDTLTCYKLTDYASQHDPLWNVDNSKVTTRFAWPPVDRPEAALIGLSYNYGGANAGGGAIGGYRVYYTNDWVFANTGLHNGDLIGQFSNIADDILAQETDATYYGWSEWLAGTHQHRHDPHARQLQESVGIHVADTLPLCHHGLLHQRPGGHGLQCRHVGLVERAVRERPSDRSNHPQPAHAPDPGPSPASYHSAIGVPTHIQTGRRWATRERRIQPSTPTCPPATSEARRRSSCGTTAWATNGPPW